MELDEESVDGHWATNMSGVEFFIINDATFSKLCILGSDVEPCFEGASVTDKQVSKDFAYNSEFIPTLFTMMNELKDALQYDKGGSDMENKTVEAAEIKPADFTTDPADETAPAVQFDDASDDDASTDDASADTSDDAPADGAADDYAAAPASDDDDDEKEDEGEDEEADKDAAVDDEDERKPKSEHSLEDVEAEFAAVQAELETTKSLLETANAELESLRAFKLGVENQQKDALISKYHMLSDEARNEISEHKSEYSLEEIESKLALAFVKENVDFEQVDGKAVEVTEEANPVTTFSLDAAVDTTVVSPVLQALRDAKNN